MTGRDDQELMRLLGRGDMAALRELYERHARFVYRVALRFLGNEDDARDVAQSVFADLIDAARGFKPRGRVTTWLYRVTVNRCLNQAKSARVRMTSQASSDQLERMESREADAPDRRMERQQERRRIREAIDRLPRRQRCALVLRQYEGLSYKDLARAMGCSRGSVESLLVRARRRLLELLEE